MIPPVEPENEAKRMDVLCECEILDTKNEGKYDDLVQLAQQLTDCPIALVSIIDSDRQWFKAKVGLDAAQTSRDISFCGHVVFANKLIHVEDATEDERFFDNPLVAGPPFIRCYAGAPLRHPSGVVLGTLCVIDSKARKLNKRQLQSLELLANQVVTHIVSQQESRISRIERQMWEEAILVLKDEILSPMHSVSKLCNAAQSENISEKSNFDFLSSVQSGLNKLVATGNQLHHWFDLIYSQQVTWEEPVIFDDIMRRVAQNIERNRTTQKIINIKHDFDANAHIIGDVEALTQLLLNLITYLSHYSEGQLDVSIEQQNISKSCHFNIHTNIHSNSMLPIQEDVGGLVLDTSDEQLGMDKLGLHVAYLLLRRLKAKIEWKEENGSMCIHLLLPIPLAQCEKDMLTQAS